MELKNYKPKVSKRNKFYLDTILKLADSYKIIGVVDIEGLPAKQFQKIKGAIGKDAKIFIAKKRVIKIALEKLEKKFPGISKLSDKLTGITGLIFTNENPFKLQKILNKNKSSAPAKPNTIAPTDIVVTAGPTPFSPGPIIGELGKFKIKTAIVNGKVEIKEDTVVAKEGDVISPELANILSRLNINPIEVGINVKAIYEDKVIFDSKVLNVNEEEIFENIKSAYADAFKLSIGLEYYTNENIEHFIKNAYIDSLKLGIGISYPAAETIKELINKAYAESLVVSAKVNGEEIPAGNQPVSGPDNNKGSDNEGKEEKKEEKSEENIAAGLGSLF